MEMEEFAYPRPVKVIIKVRKGLRTTTKTMWTFKNPDGTLWEERFEDAGYFNEGLASVKLEDGWTYVDVKHTLWEERFEKAGDFGEVRKFLNYGVSYPIPGIASVTFNNGREYLVDHDRNVCPMEFKSALYDMSVNNFLGLETDCFGDEGFVKMAVGFVKRDLLKQVKGRKEVDDEYAKYCSEALTAVDEKIKKEKAEIERLAKDKPKSDKKREELIKKIEDFEITGEKK